MSDNYIFTPRLLLSFYGIIWLQQLILLSYGVMLAASEIDNRYMSLLTIFLVY